jgi:hypothetical protein
MFSKPTGDSGGYVIDTAHYTVAPQFNQGSRRRSCSHPSPVSFCFLLDKQKEKNLNAAGVTPTLIISNNNNR